MRLLSREHFGILLISVLEGCRLVIEVLILIIGIFQCVLQSSIGVCNSFEVTLFQI